MTFCFSGGRAERAARHVLNVSTLRGVLAALCALVACTAGAAPSGGIGGSTSFAPGAGLAYSMEWQGAETHLGVAVIVRGSQPEWLRQGPDGAPSHAGSGGSVGPHYIVHDPSADVVWVDDTAYPMVGTVNVLLFDRNASGEPVLVGSTTIGTFISEAPAQRNLASIKTLRAQLLELLRADPHVQMFIDPPEPVETASTSP